MPQDFAHGEPQVYFGWALGDLCQHLSIPPETPGGDLPGGLGDGEGGMGREVFAAQRCDGQRGKVGRTPGRGGLPVAAQAEMAQTLLPGFPGTAPCRPHCPRVPVGPQGRAVQGQQALSAELSGVDQGPGISEGLKPPALNPWGAWGKEQSTGRAGNPLPASPCTGVNPSPRLPTHRDGTETPPTRRQLHPSVNRTLLFCLPSHSSYPRTDRVFLPDVLTRPKPIIAPITQPGVTVY